ncbi:MAG: hypothetical protein CVT90_02785 [Candidatus Altiarchaeales archaeon HGW-Altiarchaeales-3]|nr:MAG: hypothetical protein CVT90_02785 [Candidatus Altiarchaeales archaeon HGW-Altiarchaeales-3]
MMEYFYPEHLKKMFTNRKRELKDLEYTRDSLDKGTLRNISFFGLRRIGKSLLIKEFMYRNPGNIYINIEEIASSPEFFSLRYIGYIAYWLNENGDALPDDYMEINALIKKCTEMNIKALTDAVTKLNLEFSKEKRDHNFLLGLAFTLPEKICREKNKKIMLFLDEFQALAVLKKSPQVLNPFALFRSAIQNQSGTSYVLAGSQITKMRSILEDHKEPLFLQFNVLNIEPFTREDTYELCSKILPGQDTDIFESIYKYSYGHPFHTTSVCERVKEYSEKCELEITNELISQAFLVEVLSKEGNINKFCRYLYDISLEKARGYGILKAILTVLAEKEGTTITEIARGIKRSPQATKKYLMWLEEVDLITKYEKTYFYKDPVFRTWLAYYEKGIELGIMPKREMLKNLLSNLEEKYLRTSSELGRAKEFETKVKLEKKLGIELKNYMSKDGQIEIDLAGKKDALIYLVEIKWKNKSSDYKDIENFLKKTEKSEFSDKEKKLFFISKSGFTSSALKLAKSNNVTVLDRNLEAIEAVN